jgi:Protein of unknown function (DUF2695)
LAEDKERKKALKREGRRLARERDAAEWDEHMVLEPTQLKALLDYLDEALGREPCDHTPRHTIAWADELGLDTTQVLDSVRHFGGSCDCEVLGNVDPESRVDSWPRYLELVGRDG